MWDSMCAFEWVCERKRERETRKTKRERKRTRENVKVLKREFVWMCVCREREKKRDREMVVMKQEGADRKNAILSRNWINVTEVWNKFLTEQFWSALELLLIGSAVESVVADVDFVDLKWKTDLDWEVAFQLLNQAPWVRIWPSEISASNL